MLFTEFLIKVSKFHNKFTDRSEDINTLQTEFEKLKFDTLQTGVYPLPGILTSTYTTTKLKFGLLIALVKRR